MAGYIRDFYSGMASLASNVAKSPALLYTMMQPVQVGSGLVNKEDSPKPPEFLYKNALTNALDESSARESYIRERWHSKGENLTTLIKNKKLDEIPSYLAHAVVSNAPQQIAIAAATLSGLGTPALLALGGSAASESYARNLAEGEDSSASFTNAMIAGAAEVAFERVGTMQVTKNLQKTLAKHLGKEAAERVTKDAFREIAGSIVKGAASEAAEEAATSIVTGISGNVTGVDKQSVGDILADTFESAVIGGLSSATMTAPMSTAGQVVEANVRDRRNKTIKEYGGSSIVEGDNKVSFIDRAGQTQTLDKGEASAHKIKLKLDPAYKDTWDAQELYLEESRVKDNETQIAKSQYSDMIKRLDGNPIETDEELYYASDFIENPNTLEQKMSEVELGVLERKRNSISPEQYIAESNRIAESYAEVDPTVREALQVKDPKMLAKMEKAKARLETDQGFVNTLNVIMQDLSQKGEHYRQEGVLDRVRRVYVPHSYMTTQQFDDFAKNKVRLDQVKFRHQRLYNTLAEARLFDNIPLRRTMTGNYEAYINRMNQAVNVKKFKRILGQSRLVTTRPSRDYVALGDDGTFVDDRGNQLYARKDVAKEVNAIFSDTPLRSNQFFHAIRKVNAISKNIRLLTGLFHHWAFGLAYLMATPHIMDKTLSRLSKGDLRGAGTAFQQDFNPLSAYKNGLELWKSQDDIVNLLIRKGLTLGRIQDWDERLVSESNIISKLADKNNVSKAVKDRIVASREGYTNFLFGKLGAGLKVKSAMFIMQDQMQRNPGMSAEQAAKDAAEIVNNNFGGLDLKGMRRNPTLQYLWQTFTFAPDWTESNFRFYARAIANDTKTSKDLHRRVMAGVLSKYAIATVALNLLMATMREPDDEERERKSTLLENFMKGYSEAWQDGKLNWMRVNVTPFLQKFGAKDNYYYNVAGFFLDPTKWLSRDIKKGETIPKAIEQTLSPERLVRSFAKSAYYKSSAVPQMIGDFVMDSDYTFWRGFTDFDKLIDKRKISDWDYGLAGKGRIKPIGLGQVPSYALYESQKFIPIQANNFIQYMLGELEGAEFVLRMFGQDVRRGYRVKPKD